MANPELQLDFIPTRDGTKFRRRTKSELLRSQARETSRKNSEEELIREVGTNIPDKSIVRALRIFGATENETIGRVIVIQKDPKTKELVQWEYVGIEPANLLKEPMIRMHFMMGGADGFGPPIDVDRTFADLLDLDNILPSETGFITLGGGIVFKDQKEPRRIYGFDEGFRITIGGEVGIYRKVNPGQLQSLEVAPKRFAS